MTNAEKINTLKAIIQECEEYQWQRKETLFEIIKELEQEPKCKDCKWWKDSDGKYRRGYGAESVCRINTDKVYQGEGYCYLYEPNILER